MKTIPELQCEKKYFKRDICRQVFRIVFRKVLVILRYFISVAVGPR